MKTLIISDVHLTHRFDEKKFIFLKYLLSSVDQVILNGDFWDGYRTTFDLFLNSQWNQLFPLLRAKKTVYLYGNHDQQKFSDKRVSQFSFIQKENHKIKTKDVTYHIEHGHLLCPSIDLIYPLSKKSLFYINFFFQKIEHILTILRSPHNILLKHENAKIKRCLSSVQFPYWYICGHTHYAELDMKNKFANSGSIQFGQATYLIIDSSGISLQSNWY
ncbi:MAG: metallophosphoesterase family protein [Candidatus Roizmanbacteria bacterium]|nr:metallophosphoesterase family protein [Candidatus Roizmanbacteria bacterium]